MAHRLPDGGTVLIAKAVDDFEVEHQPKAGPNVHGCEVGHVRFMDGQVSVAPEVRLRSNLFGLTPAGRQQRHWMITDQDLERAGISLDDQLTELREQRAKRLAPDEYNRPKLTRGRSSNGSRTATPGHGTPGGQERG